MTLGPCPSCGEEATDLRGGARPRLPLKENFRVTCRSCGARLAPDWKLWGGLTALGLLFVLAAYPLGEWVGQWGSVWVLRADLDPFLGFMAVSLVVAVGCLLVGLVVALGLEVLSWRLGWWRAVPAEDSAAELEAPRRG